VYSLPPPSAQYCNYSHDYTFVLQILSTYDWSCVYSHTSPNSTAEQLSTVVTKSLDFFIPYSHHNKSKYLHWFPNTMKYYIHSKRYFSRHYKKNLSPDVYSTFSYFHKLVKATIMSYRLRWLKSVEDNLKTQLRDFWKLFLTLKGKLVVRLLLILNLHLPSLAGFCNTNQFYYNQK
jgi:hypothetical protein